MTSAFSRRALAAQAAGPDFGASSRALEASTIRDEAQVWGTSSRQG